MKNLKNLNLAIIILSIIIVWGGDYIFTLKFDFPYSLVEEMVPRIMRMFLIYLPYGLIYLYALGKFRQIRKIETYKSIIASYIIGAIISLSMWGYSFYDGYDYLANEKTGGVNIGLGIILMASPMIITLIMFATYKIMAVFVYKTESFRKKRKR